MPLDRRLAAKGARVSRVLADFHLLDLFAEGGAVSVGRGGKGVCQCHWAVVGLE